MAVIPASAEALWGVGATCLTPLSCKSLRDVLPHTPQADEIVKRRSRFRDTSAAAVDRVAITTFARCLGVRVRSPQTFTPMSWLGLRTIPSPHRKPAANSRSEPGVRIVTASVVSIDPRLIRISSGSSTTTLSRRIPDPSLRRVCSRAIAEGALSGTGTGQLYLRGFRSLTPRRTVDRTSTTKSPSEAARTA
jgi:hypothetical protein